MGLGGDGGPILSSSWLVSDRLGDAGKVGIGRQAQGPGVKPRASPVTPTIAKFAAALCPLRGHPCCPLEVPLPGTGSCCHPEVALFCPEERALPGGGPLSLVLSGTCGGGLQPCIAFLCLVGQGSPGGRWPYSLPPAFQLQARAPGERARLPDYCAGATFVQQLLCRGYGFDERTFGGVSFQKKVGAGGPARRGAGPRAGPPGLRLG